MHQKLNTGRLTGSFVLEWISFSIPSNSIIFSMSSCSFMCTSVSLCSDCSGSLSKFEKRLWLAPQHKLIAFKMHIHTCTYGWPYWIWIYFLDTLCSMGSTLPALVFLHRSLARSHTPPAYERNLIWWHCGIDSFIIFLLESLFSWRWLTWKIISQFRRTILSDLTTSSNELRTWHAANMLCHPYQMLSADLPQSHKEWLVLHREMHAFDFLVMSAASLSILSSILRPSIGSVSIANIHQHSQLWK